jgi:hypothetical protein
MSQKHMVRLMASIAAASMLGLGAFPGQPTSGATGYTKQQRRNTNKKHRRSGNQGRKK